MRSFLCVLAVGAFAVAASGPATAASVPFTGTLEIEIGGVSTGNISGGGTASLNDSGGTLPIGKLVLPAGAFQSVAVTPVGSTTIQNLAITVSTGGTCTAGHTGVSCPGGGLAGFGGLAGSAFFGNLFVPLNVVGAGSTTATRNGGTISGAGWTTGTAAVFFNGTSRDMGALSSATLDTATVTLVSPIRVFNAVSQTFEGGFARISIHLVPEPATLLLLGAGVAGLAIYGRRRMRR